MREARGPGERAEEAAWEGRSWKFCQVGDGRTNIVGVELVHPPDGRASRDPQRPHCNIADDGELARVQVVLHARVEADVRVDNKGHSEDAVEDGL